MSARKLIATFTAICFIYSSIIAPAVQATNVPAITPVQFKESLDRLMIPATVGRITSGKYFGSSQVVINIQDLHCNSEVQRNISRILGELDGKYHLKSVYLEGGYGDIDTSMLGNMQDKHLKKAVTEGLLDRGRLTGAEYYAITKSRNDLLKGIEDEDLHKGNVQRLGKILDKKSFFEGKAKGLDKDIEFLQAKFFNANNRRFNEAIEQYKAGQINAEKYYKLLEKHVEKINADPDARKNIFTIRMSNYPNIESYLEILEMGKHLPYQRIAREMQRFITVLKQRLPYEAYNCLLEKTDNFSNADKLYVALSQTAKDYRIDLSSYPALKLFFAYIDKGQQVNPVVMVKEEKRLVEQIRIGLSRDISELEVSFVVDFYAYFKDYLFNRLAADDHEYFIDRFAKFKDLWDKYTYVNHLKDLEPEFSLLDEYYKTNVERNQVFLQKIQPGCQPRGVVIAEQGDGIESTVKSLDTAKDIIVVVAGGFHTEGMEELLAERGISYLSITPNVTHDTKTSSLIYEQLAKQQSKITCYQKKEQTAWLNPTRAFAKKLITIDFKHSDALGLTIACCQPGMEQYRAVAAFEMPKVAAAIGNDINKLCSELIRIDKEMGRSDTFEIQGNQIIASIDGQILKINADGSFADEIATTQKDTQVALKIDVEKAAVAAEHLADWTFNQPAAIKNLFPQMITLMLWCADRNLITGDGFSFEFIEQNRRAEIAEYYHWSEESVGKLPVSVQEAMGAFVVQRESLQEAIKSNDTVRKAFLAVADVLNVHFEKSTTQGGKGFGLSKNESTKKTLSDYPVLQKIYESSGESGEAVIEALAAMFLVPLRIEVDEIILSWKDQGFRERFLKEHYDPARSDIYNLIGYNLRKIGLQFIYTSMRLATPFGDKMVRSVSIITHILFNIPAVPLGIALAKMSQGESFRIRGIGFDTTPGCFACGGNKGMYHNIAAFVESKESGERVVKMFKSGAWLDYRQHEPNRIQVKVGACDKHLHNLEQLRDNVKASDGIITTEIIADAEKGKGETSSNKRGSEGFGLAKKSSINKVLGNSNLIEVADTNDLQSIEIADIYENSVVVIYDDYQYSADKNMKTIKYLASKGAKVVIRSRANVNEVIAKLRKDNSLVVSKNTGKLGNVKDAAKIMESGEVFVLGDLDEDIREVEEYYSLKRKLKSAEASIEYWTKIENERVSNMSGRRGSDYEDAVAEWQSAERILMSNEKSKREIEEKLSKISLKDNQKEEYIAAMFPESSLIVVDCGTSDLPPMREGALYKGYSYLDPERERKEAEEKRKREIEAKLKPYEKLIKAKGIDKTVLGLDIKEGDKVVVFADINDSNHDTIWYLSEVCKAKVIVIARTGVNSDADRKTIENKWNAKIRKGYYDFYDDGKFDLRSGRAIIMDADEIQQGLGRYRWDYYDFERWKEQRTSYFNYFREKSHIYSLLNELKDAKAVIVDTGEQIDTKIVPSRIERVGGSWGDDGEDWGIYDFTKAPPSKTTVYGFSYIKNNNNRKRTAKAAMLPINKGKFVAGEINGIFGLPLPGVVSKYINLFTVLSREQWPLMKNWYGFYQSHGEENAALKDAIWGMSLLSAGTLLLIVLPSLVVVFPLLLLSLPAVQFVAVEITLAIAGLLSWFTLMVTMHSLHDRNKVPGAENGETLAFVGEVSPGKTDELKKAGFVPIRVVRATAEDLRKAKGWLNFGFGQRGYWASADAKGNVTLHVLVKENEAFEDKIKEIIRVMTGTGTLKGNARVLQSIFGKAANGIDPKRVAVFGILPDRRYDMGDVIVMPENAIGYSAAALRKIDNYGRMVNRLDAAIEIVLNDAQVKEIEKARNLDNMAYVLTDTELTANPDKFKTIIGKIRGKGARVYIKFTGEDPDGIGNILDTYKKYESGFDGIDGLLVADSELKLDEKFLRNKAGNPALKIAQKNNMNSGEIMPFCDITITKNGCVDSITGRKINIDSEEFTEKVGVYRIILEEGAENVRKVLEKIPKGSTIVLNAENLRHYLPRDITEQLGEDLLKLLTGMVQSRERTTEDARNMAYGLDLGNKSDDELLRFIDTMIEMIELKVDESEWEDVKKDQALAAILYQYRELYGQAKLRDVFIQTLEMRIAAHKKLNGYLADDALQRIYYENMQEQMLVKTDEATIKAALDRFRSSSFANYYDEQSELRREVVRLLQKGDPQSIATALALIETFAERRITIDIHESDNAPTNIRGVLAMTEAA